MKVLRIQTATQPSSDAQPISNHIACKNRSGHQSPEHDAERNAPLCVSESKWLRIESTVHLSTGQCVAIDVDRRPGDPARIAVKNLGWISSPHSPRHPPDSDVPPKDRPSHRKRPEDVPASGQSPVDSSRIRRGSPILSGSPDDSNRPCR